MGGRKAPGVSIFSINGREKKRTGGCYPLTTAEEGKRGIKFNVSFNGDTQKKKRKEEGRGRQPLSLQEGGGGGSVRRKRERKKQNRWSSSSGGGEKNPRYLRGGKRHHFRISRKRLECCKGKNDCILTKGGKKKAELRSVGEKKKKEEVNIQPLFDRGRIWGAAYQTPWKGRKRR